MSLSGEELVLIGGGGHCKSVLDAILSEGAYAGLSIVDAALPQGFVVDGVEVVGDDDVLEGLHARGVTHAFVTVGSVESTVIRRRVYEQARRIGFKFPVIADPSARIAEHAAIGEGSFVGKNAVVNADAQVGEMAIVNTGAVVEHDCFVGDFSHVSVGAVLCGEVEVGEDVFVGANATVIQGVKVGSGSVIGAGSVVLRDVPDGAKVVGVWNGRAAIGA